MSWLTGDWGQLGVVAGKAVLIYLTAMVALRLGERRTLAEWTIIDFATAVAMGAIIGRTAIASRQSWVTGAVAVAVLVAIHRVVSILRMTKASKLIDHRVRVLVERGEIRHRELRRCGITENDLYAHLRQQGVFDVRGLRYVLYETTGTLTVVQEPEDDGPDAPLVTAGLRSAVHLGDRAS
ncbi:MAG TPA: YetF domain-containing protein [Mycobacteriales bacterium]|nr:YetF domain-containing protein [Mycobacteriales bacterium]